ncbi:phospholipase A2 [Hamadaea sp. NPDC050747]|uniref:phospholipase A2 n=1 Tax=Hamadaea sp. NPDC050747 TaxID=3155789 RepID=UPI0033F6C074
MWAAYGNAGGHWTGGDSTVSVPLPDGRLVWLFSDTFLGTVNADFSRPTNTPMVNNTMVVQDGTTLGATLHGGTASAPKSLVDTGVSTEMYWVGDGIASGATLNVLYNRYRKTGDGSLDVELVGTALATFALPALTLSSVTMLPVGNKIAWGTEILQDGGQTYVYGVEHAGGMKFAHVARTASGLGGAWQFWDGTTWSSTEASSQRLFSGVGGFSVDRIGSDYVLISQDTDYLFGPSIVAHVASTPTGPFGPPQYLFDAPEPGANSSHIIYDVRTQQTLATTGKLLISYNVNSVQNSDNFADARIYRPRFAEVPWPFPTPDPAAVPARPTGLSIDGDGDPIRLTWSAVAGATGYRVYRRDVTAGQTYFTRQPAVEPGTSVEISLLTDGHTYEFRVAAVNAAGESLPSDTRSVVIDVAPPGTPANVTAVASGSGEIVLNWSAVAGPAQYRAYLRDVSEQQTEFTAMEMDSAFGTTTTARKLANDHDYEFVVTALNGGGESPRSRPASARAHYDAPVAPAALTATANADGTISLTWTAPGPELYYWIYQRDVTAGDTTFLRLAYPVTQGSSFTAGALEHQHQYEFKVSAINAGGEGPASTPARATALYALPGTPVGVSATANPDASVTLTWTAPGDNLWYWVYQKDVTAGETSFTRLAYPVTDGVTARPGGLLDTHEYDFAVSAINAGGEGALSNPVRVRARYDAPAAPTGLQTTVNGDGSVSLSWSAPAPNLYYWVYQRDVTAGETTLQRSAYPVTEGTSARPGLLTQGHEYEFAVSAVNGGGEGPKSTPVRATARYDLPGTPTDVQAVPGDGQVTLTWNAPAPDLWFWTYYRDVTAGDTEFSRSAYPVTSGTTQTLGWLANGHDYEFKVSAVNAGGEGAASAVVTAKPLPPLPAQVTGLTAAANDLGEIALNWTAPAENLWYWVYVRDVTAGESTFTKLAYPVTTGPSWTATGLTHGHLYEYKIAGVNAAGDGPASAVASATAHYALPAAPTNLRATTAGDGTISLTWDAPAPGLWFWVYQRDVTAGQTSFTRGTYPATSTTATTGALVDGHLYEFKVSSINGGGEGPASAPVQITAHGGLPLAPSALTATAGNAQVQLSWTASPTANVYYWIYYRDTAGTQGFTRLEYPASGTTATVGSLTNGHLYEFIVTATNASGDSPASNVASAKPMPPAPTAPTGLSAIADNGKVGLGWQMNSTADRYNIYYRDTTAGQTGWTKHPVSPAEWWYTVAGLTNGHRYEFRVTSVNLTGESGPSTVVAATPVPPAPQAPTGLTAVAGNGQVSLSWNASATPNVYYWVYYRPQGQTTWYYYQNPTTATSFTAKPLWNGYSVEFKVTAANLGGQSGFSNTVSATPFYPPPAAPSGLQATAGDGKVTLTWTASPTPNVYYWIYYRPQGHSEWYYFKYPASGTRFVATGLLNGFTYEFKVTAANLAGQSGYSNTVSAKPFQPLPAAPTGLQAAAGDGTVTLTWNASTTPNVYYWIYYRAQGQSAWYYFKYPASGTRFVATGLLNGFTYEFKVTAANLAGQSGYSNTVSARPVPPPPFVPSLRATSHPGYIWLEWQCTLFPGGPVALWIEHRLNNGAWIRATLPIWHQVGLCDQGRSFDTTVFVWGQYIEFRLVAERITTAVSNVVGANQMLSIPSAYVLMTSPTNSGWGWFWAGKSGSTWSEYGFDWSDDGCSNSPDRPFGFNFLPGCQRHDFGYSNNRRAGLNAEPWRERVDYTLLWDLRNECAKYSSHQSDCYAYASLYYSAVRKWGRGAWDS